MSSRGRLVLRITSTGSGLAHHLVSFRSWISERNQFLSFFGPTLMAFHFNITYPQISKIKLCKAPGVDSRHTGEMTYFRFSLCCPWLLPCPKFRVTIRSKPHANTDCWKHVESPFLQQKPYLSFYREGCNLAGEGWIHLQTAVSKYDKNNYRDLD